MLSRWAGSGGRGRKPTSSQSLRAVEPKIIHQLRMLIRLREFWSRSGIYISSLELSSEVCTLHYGLRPEVYKTRKIPRNIYSYSVHNERTHKSHLHPSGTFRWGRGGGSLFVATLGAGQKYPDILEMPGGKRTPLKIHFIPPPWTTPTGGFLSHVALERLIKRNNTEYADVHLLKCPPALFLIRFVRQQTSSI